MFYIIDNMFPSSNGNIYFKSPYSSSNFSVLQSAKSAGHQHSLTTFERGYTAAVNSSLSNKPLSSRNSALNRGYGEIRKSKYSIVKTAIPRSAKKNVYKWESKNVKSESLNPPVITAPIRPSPNVIGSSYQKIASNIVVEENIAKNHYRSSIPFHSLLSKGWFSAPPCSTSCVHSSSFDLQSCCFISKRFLPGNTLSLNSFQGTIPSKVDSKKADIENTPSFVKLTKHQLIRKPQPELPKIPSSVVLCTKRKLIRESAPPLKIQDQIKLPSSDTKPDSSELKNSIKLPADGLRSPLAKKKRPTLPLVVLTDRKLIRETETSREKLPTATSPTKLIRVNRNKLIRSSLLQKFTKRSSSNYVKPARSVLSQMIQYRRRPYPGTSYVLLTRNKLVRRVRYKNEVWKKNADSSAVKAVPKKIVALPEVFVSVGSNKLIRKSLFKKTNKVSPRNSVSSILPLKSKILTRMLNAPGKRVQTFTNHLSRTKLKYLANSSTRISRNRYSNKCKINVRSLRRKNSVCPVFRRKGECHKKDTNNCPYIHDSKYIMICKNYLKNSCADEHCLLSHDLIPQKVPVCLYFLNGNCEASQCPYLHVKLDSKSPICAQFLRGYCEAADKCTGWHVYACPQYKSDGKCDKGDRCGLPHRESQYFEGRCSDAEEVADDENAIAWRYFEKNRLDEGDSSGVQIIPDRASLGILPDYIPL